MSRAPSMPMFWDAYLADTTHLTTEEHGAYLLLLAAMWRRNGRVPDDDRDNARILGLTPAKWRRVKDRLRPFLTFNDGQITAPILGEWEDVSRKPSRPWIPVDIQRQVRDRDGGRCAYCGDTEGPFHLDHIVPWARGGDHSPENLTVACAACNWSKGDKPLDEWRPMQ